MFFFFATLEGFTLIDIDLGELLAAFLMDQIFLWILENNIRQFLRSDYEDVLLLMTHFLRGVCHMAAHSAPSHSSMALSI